MRPAGPLLSRCDRARGTPGRSHRRVPGRECSHPRRAEVIRAPCPGPASRRTTSAGQVTHRPSRVRNVWSRHSDVSGMRGPALGPTRAIFLGPGPGQSVGTPADGQAGRFVDQESPWMYLAAPATHPGCARSADRYVSCRRPASPMDELGRNTAMRWFGLDIGRSAAEVAVVERGRGTHSLGLDQHQPGGTRCIPYGMP